MHHLLSESIFKIYEVGLFWPLIRTVFKNYPYLIYHLALYAFACLLILPQIIIALSIIGSVPNLQSLVYDGWFASSRTKISITAPKTFALAKISVPNALSVSSSENEFIKLLHSRIKSWPPAGFSGESVFVIAVLGATVLLIKVRNKFRRYQVMTERGAAAAGVLSAPILVSVLVSGLKKLFKTKDSDRKIINPFADFTARVFCI